MLLGKRVSLIMAVAPLPSLFNLRENALTVNECVWDLWDLKVVRVLAVRVARQSSVHREMPIPSADVAEPPPRKASPSLDYCFPATRAPAPDIERRHRIHR